MFCILSEAKGSFCCYPSQHSFPIHAFAGIGAGASFLSALLGSVGPIMAPFFLAYGLVKSAYIGTEALSTMVMHVTKLIADHQTAVLTRFGVIVWACTWPNHDSQFFFAKMDRGPTT
jgi:hypothetical protein